MEGAWNVAVPFLCANNCYAVVTLHSGRKCTDSFQSAVGDVLVF